MDKLLIPLVHFFHFHKFCKMLEASFYFSFSPVAVAPPVGSVSRCYLYRALPPLGNLHTANLLKMLNVCRGTLFFLFFSLKFAAVVLWLFLLRCNPFKLRELETIGSLSSPSIKVTIIRPHCISIMSEPIRANSWDSSAISESALKSRRARQKIKPSYERRVYVANLITFSADPLKYHPCNARGIFRGGEGGGGRSCLVSWWERLLAVKPVKGAAPPLLRWLPPLGWLKSIILFRSTLVKLHGFIKRAGFIRAELRHSGTMSIKCGSIECKFLVITVHSCLPTASHPIETLRFCLNGLKDAFLGACFTR